MRRRDFITFLGGAAGWPLAAYGQQAGKVYRIGFLWEGPDVFPDEIEAFRQGLSAVGYVEGRNLTMRGSRKESSHWRKNWSGSRSISSWRRAPSTPKRPNKRPQPFPSFS